MRAIYNKVVQGLQPEQRINFVDASLNGSHLCTSVEDVNQWMLITDMKHMIIYPKN